MIQLNIQEKALHSSSHLSSMLSHSSSLPPVALCTALNAALLSDGKKHNTMLVSPPHCRPTSPLLPKFKSKTVEKCSPLIFGN